MSESVYSLEKIKIGGINQWISIRAKDMSNPVLLYLHGGPGTPVMPLFRYFQAPLENYFIVVQWEQRGAGKSFSWKIPKTTMTINQFMSDLYDLITILKEKFNKEKLYLMGHSWGSVLGTYIVQKYPELFYAYIGVGQASNTIETEKIMYQFVLQRSIEIKDKKAITKLRKIGAPFKGLSTPYTSFYKGGLQSKLYVYSLAAKYGGIIYHVKEYSSFIRLFLKYLPHFRPEYTLMDLLKLIQGNIFSTKVMMKELLTINLFDQVPELKVPVYILMGRYDFNWSAELAKKYFDALKAPQKDFIWFEKSAHAPNGEEPDKFNQILIEKILREISGKNR